MSLKNKSALFLVTSAVMLLAACSPKEASRWQGASFEREVGSVPSDACIVDGAPLILGASTESDGGFVLVYIRDNGDVVAHQWLPDPITRLSMQDAGEFYWTGGNCPGD